MKLTINICRMSHIKATTLTLYSVLFFLVSSVCSLLLLKRNLFCCSFKFAMQSYTDIHYDESQHCRFCFFFCAKIKTSWEYIEYATFIIQYTPFFPRQLLLLLFSLNQPKSSHILCLTRHFLIDIITSFSNCNNLYIIIIYDVSCVADGTYIA